eukprot:2858443-Alexandrium_andersonii.AAC.1
MVGCALATDALAKTPATLPDPTLAARASFQAPLARPRCSARSCAALVPFAPRLHLPAPRRDA